MCTQDTTVSNYEQRDKVYIILICSVKTADYVISS